MIDVYEDGHRSKMVRCWTHRNELLSHGIHTLTEFTRFRTLTLLYCSHTRTALARYVVDMTITWCHDDDHLITWWKNCPWTFVRNSEVFELNFLWSYIWYWKHLWKTSLFQVPSVFDNLWVHRTHELTAHIAAPCSCWNVCPERNMRVRKRKIKVK